MDNQISFLETPGAAYQDTSFTFKVFAAAERVVLLPDALLYYRQDNENSSVHSAEKASYVRTEYEEINRFLTQRNAYSILGDVRNEAMFHTYVWNYVRLKPELCKAFLNEIQMDFLQLQQKGQLQMDKLLVADARMLGLIIKEPDQFWNKEQAILKLRRKVPNQIYRALLIGRTAGLGCMVQAVIKRLSRK